MSAATAGRNKPVYESFGLVKRPVAAGETIYLNTLVCLNSSGYLVNGADTAGLKCVGFAAEGADNSAGADGDVEVLVNRTGAPELVGSGLTVADAETDVYISDNQTVTTTPGNVYAGKIVRHNTATAPIVDVSPAILAQEGGRLFNICATYIGAPGHSVAVAALENFEMPRKFRVLRGYADAQTAPGGAYVCTITITDGVTPKTVTITGSATHGETEDIDTDYAADTDIDITVQDDNASAATADIKIVFVCQEL